MMMAGQDTEQNPFRESSIGDDEIESGSSMQPMEVIEPEAQLQRSPVFFFPPSLRERLRKAIFFNAKRINRKVHQAGAWRLCIL